MSSVKINDYTVIKIQDEIIDSLTGLTVTNALTIYQDFKDGDKRQISLKYDTLEAIYKEYKRKIFNDEMKEIINE